MESALAKDKDWQVVTLGELCSKSQYGWTTRAAATGSVKFLRTTDITGGPINWATVPYCEEAPQDLDKYLLHDGDIVISRAGSVGISRLIEQPQHAVFASYLIRFRPNEKVLPRYLSHYLQSPSYWKQVEENAVGIALQNLNASKLSDFLIPVAPKDEQDKIVAHLDLQSSRLDAGIAALKRAQENLKRYRASVLQAAVTGRLVPTEHELAQAEGRDYETGDQLLKRILTERRQSWTGKGKYKEPTAPKTINLPELPEGWTSANVEQLVRAPLCNGVSIKGQDQPPGVRALRLSAMSENGFDYSDVRYLPLNNPDSKGVWIEEGDYFVSRGNGSLHLVGRGTVAQKPPEPTIFPDTMIRLRFTEVNANPGWAPLLWSSRLVREQIEARVKTTAGIYKISQPQLESIVIPFPPLAEQERLVAEVERRLSVADALEATLTATLRRATRLRQAILKKAFSISGDTHQV